MKKIITLFSLLLFSLVALADQVTYDFSASIPSPWSCNVAPQGYEASGSARGTQFHVGKGSPAVLTLKNAKNVTKITMVCSANLTGNTIDATVGGKSFGSEKLDKETAVTKTFSGSATDGDIVLTINLTKSFYVKSIIVEGSVEGGGEGGGGATGPTEADLDAKYVYSEPTQVSAASLTEAVSAQPYAFIQHNILVKCNNGAIALTAGKEYFSCYANSQITFTASKPIKGLTINGMVKKNFDAECDNGEMAAYFGEDEDVEDDPVVAILDIDAKSVTITCSAQMRCYSVDFYFDENPDVETGGGGEDETELSFDWEPDTPTTLSIAYDELEFTDYTSYVGYPYTDLYFVSDEYEMEIAAFVSAVEGTVLPVGTYEFTDSYENGTLQASPGGGDMYDYPAYIATDFVYYEEYEQWSYNTSYYIVSGTMKVEKDPAGVKITIDAKTAKGSTVKATFVGQAQGELDDAIEDVKGADVKANGKFMQDGRIVIRKDGKTYGVAGVKRV